MLILDCEESVRSFDASQYSEGHSFSSDENLFQLTDLDKNLESRSSSPGLPVTSVDVQSNMYQKNIEDQNEVDSCKEVRCIELEDPITNTYTHSNPEALRSSTYTDSNATSPCENTAASGLIAVDNGDKRLNHKRQEIVLPSPEKNSSLLTRSSSISLRLSRSSSCKASLLGNSSSDWFEEDDAIQNTPPTGNEKDFVRRPEGFQWKVYRLSYDENAERPTRNGHGSSAERSPVDVQNVKSSTDKESESNGSLTPQGKETENLKSLNLLADHEVSFNNASSFFVSSSPYWSYFLALMVNISYWIYR